MIFLTRSLLLASAVIQIFPLMMSKENKECSSRTKVDDLDLSFFWENATCKAAGKAERGDKIDKRKTRTVG